MLFVRYTPIALGGGGGGSGGVTSLNGLTGALTLAAGSGITITPSGGNTLTIASTVSGFTYPTTDSTYGGTNTTSTFTGTANYISGIGAGAALTAGGQNVAIGPAAMASNTVGMSNTAIGHNALLNVNGGNGNTAVGEDALLNSSGGFYNSALGNNALVNIIGAHEGSIGLGAYAGNGLPSASNTLFIGSNVKNINLINIASSNTAGAAFTSPLQFNFGTQLSTTTAQPVASATYDGLLWNIQGGVGVADQFQICLKDASNTYAWQNIVTSGGGGGFATTQLNNLGTTAINASLLVDSDQAYDLGDSTNSYNNLWVASLLAPGATTASIDFNNQTISDPSNVTALDFQARVLVDSSGNPAATWASGFKLNAAMDANSFLIHNGLDPINPQDLATKNYVDTHGGSAITSLTGDVTGSGPGATATTIAANAVTNAKAAQMAAHTFKGNNTGSTANAIDLTATQLTAELNVFTSSLKGLAPSSSGGTTNFLRADGTWAAPAGTAVSFAAVGSTPNSNGGSVSSNVITLQPFDGSNPGVTTTGAQTVAGVKTFNSAPNLASLNVSEVVVTDGSHNLTTIAYADTSPTASTIARRNSSGDLIMLSAKIFGSTSGTLTFSAADTTTSYQVKMPSAQGTGALTNNGSGALSWAAAGTVSSVAATVPQGFAISGSPITTSGTLAITATTEFDAGNSSTAITINFNTAVAQKITLTGNATLTLSNMVSGAPYVLRLVQDATGSRTVTWPAAVKWPGGVAPTLTTTASAIDVISIYYDGTNAYASAGLAFA